MRIETPTITEVSGGLRHQCSECTFKAFSLPGVAVAASHLCADHTVVRWEAQAIKGQKTSPPSEGHLAVLARAAAKKGTRR